MMWGIIGQQVVGAAVLLALSNSGNNEFKTPATTTTTTTLQSTLAPSSSSSSSSSSTITAVEETISETVSTSSNEKSLSVMEESSSSSTSSSSTSKKKYDAILDWERPSKEEYQEDLLEALTEPMNQLYSPCYFSTDERTGKRWKGLVKLLPKRRRSSSRKKEQEDDEDAVTKNPASQNPILVVGNHQFIGYDPFMFAPKLYQDCDIWLRGLVHPLISNTIEVPTTFGGVMTTQPSRSPGNSELIEKVGGVRASPRNFYRLLQSGQDVLMFPGGLIESFQSNRRDKAEQDAYRLFWSEKVDFVRVAAKFNATILPLSAIGLAESFNVLIENEQWTSLPLGIGERIREFSDQVPAGRYNLDASDEVNIPPLALPALPARNYFLFGRPYHVGHLDHRDKEACLQVYKEIQAEVEKGITDLLQARKSDPFRDPVRRLAFERLTGKQAPTFSVDELNNR